MGIAQRIARRQIFADGAGGITLAMDNDAIGLQADGLRPAGGKYRHIAGQRHILRDLAGCIMIAGDDKDPDSCLLQPAHLSDKKEPGIVVLPVTIIEITRDQDKGDLFGDGKINQINKGPPRRPANLGKRGIFLQFKPF